MAIAPIHEMHRRRWSRNLGLGLVLGAFVALIFGLTIVKVGEQGLGAAPHPPATSTGTAP